MKPPEGMTINPRPRLWCLTHDCWDGDCGVLGQHEVEPRFEATFVSVEYLAALRATHDHAFSCQCSDCALVRREDGQ